METSALNISFNEALKRIGNTAPKNCQESISEGAKPFIKWAGGKRSIINTLLDNVPSSFNTYYEPFIGGGALFFALSHSDSVLSDINLDLVITYRVVQKKALSLIDKLQEHANNHTEDYYYYIRSQHCLENDVEVAARFIYLNKTCYNGLYRVNSKGEFNVPMGSYKSPLIADEANIIECSHSLQNTQIYYYSFECLTPQKDDFVYLDPPYHPIDSNSFTKYTKGDFTEANQIALYNYCSELNKSGVKFMLSNSDTVFINNLYKDFDIQVITAPRMINCKASGRQNTNEVLIRNYK